jgi:hypothetical protein
MKFLQTYTYTAILAILLFGCSGGEKKMTVSQPDTLLTRSEMAKILTDIHLADVIITDKALPSDSASALRQGFYEAIFKKFNHSEETIRSNFAYYKTDMPQMDSIYADIINQLSQMEASYSRIPDNISLTNEGKFNAIPTKP